jgi:hypothetical protein
VTVGDVPLKAEAVEQRLLHHPPFAHHRPNLLHPTEENQRTAPQSSGVFQRNLRIAVALVSAAKVRFSTTLHKYADWV